MDTRGSVREGRCIDCDEKIEVVNGVRSLCACPPLRTAPTAQESAFAAFMEAATSEFTDQSGNPVEPNRRERESRSAEDKARHEQRVSERQHRGR